MCEWSPIESAPKDGRKVVLWIVMPDDDPYVVSVCEGRGWSEADIGWWDDTRQRWDATIGGTPTHWQPLPEPPQ